MYRIKGRVYNNIAALRVHEAEKHKMEVKQ
jgi:hypothetical protein